MAIVVGALAVLALLPTAVQLLAAGQAPISQSAVYVQQALEAARAGLSDYVNHVQNVAVPGQLNYGYYCSTTYASCHDGSDPNNPAFADTAYDSHWAVVQNIAAAGDESFQYLVDNSQWQSNSTVDVEVIGRAGPEARPVYQIVKSTVNTSSTQPCVGDCTGSFLITGSTNEQSIAGSVTLTVTDNGLAGVNNGDTIDVYTSNTEAGFTPSSLGPTTGSCVLSAGSCNFVSTDPANVGYVGDVYYYGLDTRSTVHTSNDWPVDWAGTSGLFWITTSVTAPVTVPGSVTLTVDNTGAAGVDNGDTVQIDTSQVLGVFKAAEFGPTIGSCVLSAGTCSFTSTDATYQGVANYFGVDTTSTVDTFNQVAVDFIGWDCGIGESASFTLMGAEGGGESYGGSGQGGGGLGAEVTFVAPVQSGTTCVPVSGEAGAQGQFTFLSILADGGPSSTGSLNLGGGQGGYTNFAGAASATGGGGGGASAVCLQTSGASGSASCSGYSGSWTICNWSGTSFTNMPCLLAVAGGGGGDGGSACVLSVCANGGNGGYTSSSASNGDGAAGGNLCVAGTCLNLGLLTAASGGAQSGSSATRGATGQTQTLSIYGGAGGGGGGGYPDGGASGQAGGLLNSVLLGITIAGGGGGGGAGGSAVVSTGGCGAPTIGPAAYPTGDPSGNGFVQRTLFTGPCATGSPIP